MIRDKIHIKFSKLPVRQLTLVQLALVRRDFSKLPVRQLTIESSPV